jgi:alkylation response protein AidB-like acyl-CoA dehydrogenase
MTDLRYTDIEEELRASVRDVLTDRAPIASVLARAETSEPYDPALWRLLGAELGVAGLAVPEHAGGHGASWREVAVVAEELGRTLAGTPFLGSAVLATALALRAEASDVLGRLAAGELTVALAVDLATTPGSGFPAQVTADSAGALSGAVRNVADAITATRLLVPATGPEGPAVYLVDAEAARRDPVVSLDLTRPLTDVSFDATPAVPLGVSGDRSRDALDGALSVGAAMLAAEQLGLAQRCLDMIVEYLKTRYQFGRQIGSFQALKHSAADLWIAVTQSRALARYAADCVATQDPDTAVAVSLAKAHCSETALRAAEECVQLHGGIGFTWEHPAHLYLKRAKADSLALGTAAAHRARLATLVNLPAPGAAE